MPLISTRNARKQSSIFLLFMIFEKQAMAIPIRI